MKTNMSEWVGGWGDKNEKHYKNLKQQHNIKTHFFTKMLFKFEATAVKPLLDSSKIHCFTSIFMQHNHSCSPCILYC